MPANRSRNSACSFLRSGALNRSRGSAHDDGHAAAVEIPPDQHADPLLLLHLQEAGDQLSELLGGGGEQLVLRERLEQRDRRLVVVRPLEQVLGQQHLLELAGQQRRLRRRLHVRLRREQPDQAGLADQRAVRRDATHADVVHARAAVHGRRAVRLRVDQQVAVLDPTAEGGLDRAQQHRLREPGALDLRQDAQARVLGGDQRTPLRGVDEVVLAVAQQHEVVGEEPLDELDRVADLAGRVAHGALAGDVGHLPRALHHGVEVAHDQADVAEDLDDLGGEVLALGVGEPAVDLEVHDGLAVGGLARAHDPLDPPVGAAGGPDHGVEEPPRRQTAGVQLLADGVHQERGVVGVGLHDGADRLVAVGGEVGVEHADGLRSGPAGIGEVEGPLHLPEELLGRDAGELLVGDAAGVGPRELRHHRPAIGLHALGDPEEEFVDHGVRARMGLGGGLCGVGHGDVGWRVRVVSDIPASNLIVSDHGGLGCGPVRHLRATFVRRGAQAAA